MFTSTTRRYPDGTPRTKHVTTNCILEIDEEAGHGTCRSYWTVLQPVDGPSAAAHPGRPLPRPVRRDDGVWRFAERRFPIDLVGDVSHHMLTTRRGLPTGIRD